MTSAIPTLTGNCSFSMSFNSSDNGEIMTSDQKDWWKYAAEKQQIWIRENLNPRVLSQLPLKANINIVLINFNKLASSQAFKVAFDYFSNSNDVF